MMVVSVGKSRAIGSGIGGPYCSAKLGSLRGCCVPWWQVKQVTRGCPAKYILLMVLTITIIWRARWIRGVATAKALRSSAASGEWQNVQSLPIALANMPIASKNVSTGMPFSSWTFLKTVSVICGAGGVVWARSVAAASRQTAVSDAAQRKVLDPSIMISWGDHTCSDREP